MGTLCYIAYPTSLTLRSANAIQTWSTLRALRELQPDVLALMPRWWFEPSRFGEVGAVHLLRPAIGKLSRFYRTTLWYYAERSVFAAMCAGYVSIQQALGRHFDAVYVREALCAAWWSGVWGPMLGIPVVYEAHDLESWNPSRAKELWVQPLIHLIDRTALVQSAHVTSLTEQFRHLLATLGWRAPEAVSVIPDAYDPAQYAPRDRAACREQLQLPPDDLLVVYSGLTFAYRGLDRLVQALADLAPTLPRMRVVLVGGRPQEIATLQQQARQLGVADRLICVGQVDQARTPVYLGAADVLVIPDTVTDVTASPLKLFEYMACQRAIVLPDLPALREILPNDAGWYFRRGQQESLTQALHAALHSAVWRTQRGQAASMLVRQYTYAERARRILDTVGKVSPGSHQIASSRTYHT